MNDLRSNSRGFLRMLFPLLGILTLVWLLRMILGAAHVKIEVTRLVSVTTFNAICLFIAVVMIHLRGLGGYARVILASVLLTAWTQILIVGSIVFSVLTGIETIYSAPEFSMPGDDPAHLRHIQGHLTFGIGLGSLAGAAAGCLFLWLLRKLLSKHIP